MDAVIQKGLVDRVYERRKAATLTLERQVRECLARGERSRIDAIVQQLCALLASPVTATSGYGYGYGNGSYNSNAKNGGLIGLAGLSIALGTECAPYLDLIVPPILACFTDTDNRVRYFACESFYNIVKVCKAEILAYFNEVFDVLSKLASDPETSVKNGAELVDRLLKDIVCEAAPYYVSRAQAAAHSQATGRVEQQMPLNSTAMTPTELAMDGRERELEAIKTFSLARFVPLLSERIHAISPFTRDFLVSWITVLDSIPQLELVSYLDDFLEGLFRYLDDANQDLRTSTAHVLDTFLDEIKENAQRRAFAQTQDRLQKDHVLEEADESASRSVSPTTSTTPSARASPVQRASTPPTRGAGKRFAHSRIPRLKRTRPESPATIEPAVHNAPDAVDGTVPTAKKADGSSEETARDDDTNKVGKPPSLEVHLPETRSQETKDTSDVAQAEDTASREESAGKGQGETKSTEEVNDKDEDTNDGEVAKLDSTPKESNAILKEEESDKDKDTATEDADQAGQADPDDAEGSEANAAGSSADDKEDWLGSASDFSEPDGPTEGNEQWLPGREVHVDHAAIVCILIRLAQENNENILATALQWLSGFLEFVQDVMVPFTPELLPVLLPLIAHPDAMIRETANRANLSLFKVIQELPEPSIEAADPNTQSQPAAASHYPPPPVSRIATMSKSASTSRSIPTSVPAASQKKPSSLRSLNSLVNGAAPAEAPAEADVPDGAPPDLFDWRETIDALVQVGPTNWHDQTRVTALEWLMMLHRKEPSKFLDLATETVEGKQTYQLLLQTLRDPSDEVVETDLRLLAQLSHISVALASAAGPNAAQPPLVGINEAYFRMFMADLMKLFVSDRHFLDARGSLIIRQLCVKLHPERTFRALAEIIEKEEDLKFASHMVQNLNFILITSPELANVRRRLRNVLSDGSGGSKADRDASGLFITLFKSWSHNSVATFSLCLLSQAYEQASNLLAIFASELDLSVSLLIQVDKLIQLLESPVFTYLRLQLLEPERYPYLSKCLYGLLMLLPQSSAFVTLRSRLSAVSNVGFAHLPPPPTRSSYAANYAAATSSSSRKKEEGQGPIKWSELVAHFRAVQSCHERASKVRDTRGTWNQTQSQARGKEVPAYVALRIAAEEYTQEQDQRRKESKQRAEQKAEEEALHKSPQERAPSPLSEQAPSLRRRTQGLLSRPPVSSRPPPSSTRGRSHSGTASSTTRARDEAK